MALHSALSPTFDVELIELSESFLCFFSLFKVMNKWWDIIYILCSIQLKQHVNEFVRVAV